MDAVAVRPGATRFAAVTVLPSVPKTELNARCTTELSFASTAGLNARLADELALAIRVTAKVNSGLAIT
jgi:hypothetical protein